MKRFIACILVAVILAVAFCGCTVTTTRTTPYPAPTTDPALIGPTPFDPMETNAPNRGYVSPRVDTARGTVR